MTEIKYVIDWEYLETSKAPPYPDVKTFCTCGWEHISIGCMSAHGQGFTHVWLHLIKKEPVTVQLADGSKIFTTKEEFREWEQAG